MSLRDSDSTKLKGDASFNFASYLADDEDLNAEYDDSVRKQLSVLQCAAICIIIEEAIDEITILGTSDDKNAEINVGLQIESLEKRAKKYIKSDPLYNEYNAEPFTTTIQKMKFTKLQIDR